MKNLRKVSAGYYLIAIAGSLVVTGSSWNMLGEREVGDLPVLYQYAQKTSAGMDSVVKKGDLIRVVAFDNRACLCREPNCGYGQEIARIKTGAILEVLSHLTVRMETCDVIWYEVIYANNRGWVSEFDTDRAPVAPRCM